MSGLAIAPNAVGSTTVITNNWGFNPVGTQTVAVGASPFTYRAGPFTETIYISGTITSAVRNAITLVGALTAGQAQIPLPPNGSVVITYAGAAPTIVRDIQ